MTTAIKRTRATKGKRRIALQVVSNMLSLWSDPAAGKWRASRGRPIRLRLVGRYRIVGEGTLTQPAGATFMPVPNRPEYLVSARFVPPESIDLQFADRRFTLNIGLLGMPVDRINWSTVKASPAGEAMTVKGVRKDEIPIDSSTVRYLVDSNYAAKMDATLKSLQFSREELQQMSRDNPPPAALLDEPGGDDLIGDSWK